MRAAKFGLALIPFIFPVIASAAANLGSDTITPAEKAIILAGRADDKDDEKRSAMWLETERINLKTGAIEISSKDFTRRAKFIDAWDHGTDDYYPYFRSFQKKKGCDSHPKLMVDMAVVRDTAELSQLPGEQVFEGLFTACANPPNDSYKSFVQKIKIVHMKLALKPLKPGAGYDLSFDPKTGTLDVGTRFYGGASNVAENTKNWVEKH